MFKSPGPWISWLRCLLLIVIAMNGACAARRSIERSDQLIDAGQPQAAVEALEEALADHPHNQELADHLQRARRVVALTSMRRTGEALDAGQPRAAWETLMPALQQADRLADLELQSQVRGLATQIVQKAQARVAAELARGEDGDAVKLADWVVEISQGTQVVDPAGLVQWARTVRSEAAEAYRRAASVMLAEHPAGAALRLAWARGLDEAHAEPEMLAAAWSRFTQRICFAPPQVEVHAETAPGAGPVAKNLQAACESTLDAWRHHCGEGTVPLRVKVLLDAVDVVDQTATAPAAEPRPGVDLATEEVVQTQETYGDTREVTVYENRVETVPRRECSTEDPTRCRVWNEPVRRHVPVRRLHVVERSHAVDHRHTLSNLPEDKIIRFDRVTVTRRMTVHGRITVEGASFVSQPFAIYAESIDSGHPEVIQGDAVLAADPIEAEDVATLVGEASERTARVVRAAVQEAAWDWAQARADQAAQLARSQPETAEELYLTMLALGLDDGPAVRDFFRARYGAPVETVLSALATALGMPLPDRAAASADLTLLFPQNHPNLGVGFLPQHLQGSDEKTLIDKGSKQ